jgi:hypothetical protein
LTSQWPRGLRNERSSLARTLGPWVRIPLKTWMSVRLFCVHVILCVGTGLATGWSFVRAVLLTMYRTKKLKKRPRHNRWLQSYNSNNNNIKNNLCYHPVDSHHQQRPAAGISHSISAPLSFPGPSYGIF